MANHPHPIGINVVLRNQAGDELVKKSHVVNELKRRKRATCSGIPRLWQTLLGAGAIGVDHHRIKIVCIKCVFNLGRATHRLGVAPETVQHEQQGCRFVTGQIRNQVRAHPAVGGGDGAESGWHDPSRGRLRCWGAEWRSGGNRWRGCGVPKFSTGIDFCRRTTAKGHQGSSYHE